MNEPLVVTYATCGHWTASAPAEAVVAEGVPLYDGLGHQWDPGTTVTLCSDCLTRITREAARAEMFTPPPLPANLPKARRPARR